MPSKLKKAIGAVKDHTSISLAKVTNGATSDLTTLEVAILKATSHDEEVPIDDRLVTDILKIISSKKSHAAACAAAIGRRIGRTKNWIVALKSLILVLRIFQDGDPYFPREVLHTMKRGSKILNLSSFRDDSNSCPWDFTAYVRTFALYLDERLDCFLTGKLQRRYTNRDQIGRISTNSKSRFRIKTNEPTTVRDMKPVMLLDKITYWQRLLNRAIATRPTGEAKSNKLVKMSLYAVVQESFDLYRDISDGLALLLDSFFHLQYQSCIQAFQACTRASKQFEELNGFYDLCKSNGIGRTSDYPSIQKISSELLETLQEFLKDQSSFPASSGSYPSPNSLLPPLPSSKDSVVSSSLDFRDSNTSGRYSDYGSYCSTLEDLMSRTDTGTSSPPMSCYSEPYGGGQDDPNGNNFDTYSTKSLPNNHSVSASDLVSMEDVINTVETKDVEDSKTETVDPWEALMLRGDPTKKTPEKPSTSEEQSDSANWLLTLEETTKKIDKTEEGPSTSKDQSESGDWLLALEETTKKIEEPSTSEEPSDSGNWLLALEETTKKKDKTEEEPSTSKDQSDSGNWLLALEATTKKIEEPSTSEAQSDSGNWLLALEETTKKIEEPSTSEAQSDSGNWLLALEETATQVQDNNSMAIVPFGLDDPMATFQATMDQYNPFLQEPVTTKFNPLPVTEFKPEPTFQANVPEDFEPSFTPTFKAKSDPFETFESYGFEDTFSDNRMVVHDQAVLQEQELWLQNQNKIIAKHLN